MSYAPAPPHSWRPRLAGPPGWPWLVLAIAGLLVLAGAVVATLLLADLDDPRAGGRDLRTRAHYVLAHGDNLHFGMHLAAGKLLDLCACTEALADIQYRKAVFHVRTPRQALLLRGARSGTAPAQAVLAAGVALDALSPAGRALGRLGSAGASRVERLEAGWVDRELASGAAASD